MIRVGTSGFSYKDWVGPYYPPDLGERDWLAFYAREFSTCELNFTYYRIPDARTLARMADKTPPGFLFALKAFQGLTHERDASRNAQAFRDFTASLQPLIDAGKFGCVLAQFPFSFHATKETSDYLRHLRDGLGDLAAVVEFRNEGWLTDATFDVLRELKLGFCCVDEPRLKGLIPPIAKATGPVAYVRFHGRNAAKWWEHKEAWERYDYSYTPEELEEWTPKIKALDAESSLTLVYTNNHWKGQAVDTARQLKLLLDL
jgi:uncharacterized protein YecE (DUF72 family)